MGLDLNDVATMFQGASDAVTAGNTDVSGQGGGSALDILESATNAVIGAAQVAAEKAIADEQSAKDAAARAADAAKSMATNAVNAAKPYEQYLLPIMAFAIVLVIYQFTKKR